MSLIRKENNLRKAQARLDKVSKRSKQFQIRFQREQNKKGKFRTKIHIERGEKEHHGRGILHKAVGLKYRVKGDKPSVTRFINNTEPKTFKGKIAKKTAQAVNLAVHDVMQTAVDTGLAAETTAIKIGDVAQREVRNKLKQKYTREAVDDYHKGVFLMGRTAVDAVKGTRNHFKQKKQFQLVTYFHTDLKGFLRSDFSRLEADNEVLCKDGIPARPLGGHFLKFFRRLRRFTTAHTGRNIQAVLRLFRVGDVGYCRTNCSCDSKYLSCCHISSCFCLISSMSSA